MSSSFGNNKRKPGATAGAVTEAKRRATLAANWDDYSKQPKVPGASIVPSIFGRNAGIQSMFFAENNGSVPTPSFIPGLNFTGYVFPGTGLPTILNPSTWGIQNNSILSNINSITTGSYLTNGNLIIYTIPLAQIPTNNAVYMTGFYKAPITGSYVFGFNSDDGIQFMINNQLIVDAAILQGGGTENASSSINLVAGTYYPIAILWSNYTGGASLKLTRITVDGTNIFSTILSPIASTYPPEFYILS